MSLNVCGQPTGWWMTTSSNSVFPATIGNSNAQRIDGSHCIPSAFVWTTAWYVFPASTIMRSNSGTTGNAKRFAVGRSLVTHKSGRYFEGTCARIRKESSTNAPVHTAWVGDLADVIRTTRNFDSPPTSEVAQYSLMNICNQLSVWRRVTLSTTCTLQIWKITCTNLCWCMN